MRLQRFRFKARHGFTLIELLAVLAIMAILALLVGQVSRQAMITSKLKQGEGEVAAIAAAVEHYKVIHGVYPRPVGGSTDPIVQAKMLYQVVTGDGSDMIDGADPVASSNREPGTESELILAAATVGRKKPSMVHPSLYLKDPWGQPYRYVRGDERADTVNKTTFDLWTQGARRPGQEADEEKWITNWR